MSQFLNTGEQMAKEAAELAAKESTSNDYITLANMATKRPTLRILEDALQTYYESAVAFTNGMFLMREVKTGELIHGEPSFMNLHDQVHKDLKEFINCFGKHIPHTEIPQYFDDISIMEKIRLTWKGFTGNLEDPSAIQEFYSNRGTKPFKDLDYNDVVYLALMHASVLDSNGLNYEFCVFEDMETIFSKISNVIYMLHALGYAIDYNDIYKKPSTGNEANMRMYRVKNFEHIIARRNGNRVPLDYYNAYYTFYNNQLFMVAMEDMPACTQIRAKYLPIDH